MPAAANITVKKNDGTTDIVYTLVSASGGDKSPFIARSQTAVGTVGQQPYISVQSRSNGDNTARRVEGKVVFPSVYTDTAQSLTKIRSTAILEFSAVLPLDIANADALEFAAQSTNLLAAALMKSTLAVGYAPA